MTTIEIPPPQPLLQAAATGAPSEYGVIEATIAPDALEIIAEWIGGTLPRPAR